MTDDNDEEQTANDAQAEMIKMMSSVKEMAIYNLSMIASQAWHHLGLAPLPGANEVKIDLEQAKLAIDLFDANLKVLAPMLEEDMGKQFKQNLTDLQLNFVNKSK